MAFSIFGLKAVTLLSCYNGPFPLVDHVTGWQIKSFLFSAADAITYLISLACVRSHTHNLQRVFRLI